MDLNQYQEAALQTRLKTADTLYAALNLASEAGEVAGKFAKQRRDNIPEFDLVIDLSIAQELGDVLWHVAILAKDLGFSLDEIARMNVDKLSRRSAQGTLGGSGDFR